MPKVLIKTYGCQMKHIIVSLLGLSILLTVFFIITSFVDFVPWTSSVDMQNFYLRRIMRFGIPIVLLQVMALVFAFTDRRRKNAA